MLLSENEFNEFERIIESELSFLRNYGFKKTPLQKIDFEYPQDKRIEVNYFSETVCVTIRWFLIYSKLEVGLIELKDMRLPERISFYGDQGCGRGISLIDLVESLTKEKNVVPLLSSHLIPGFHYDLPRIIAIYARLLESFGRQVLSGDFSIFPAIQAYSKSKL